MHSVHSIADQLDWAAHRIRSMSASFDQALAEMAALASIPDPYPDEKTPGWYAKYQIRCRSCGKFAHVTWSTDGYNPYTGDYDPRWEVDCKRCGVGEGFMAEM